MCRTKIIWSFKARESNRPNNSFVFSFFRNPKYAKITEKKNIRWAEKENKRQIMA